jgi:PAS domain S-box-containing protein
MDARSRRTVETAESSTDDHEADDHREGGDPPCWAHLEDELRAHGVGPGLVDDAQLAQLLRDLADAVIVCDPAGTIVFWNRAATRVFGWAEPEALGSSLDLIIPERLRERHWTGYRRVMASGHTEYGERLLEVPAVHRDGRTISIAFTVSLLASADGEGTAGIAAVIRDDTKRWQERRELKRDLARLRENDEADGGDE